jgi:ribose-phosphate pyrophosphokinase
MEKAEVLEIIGDVQNKNALIVDDFTLSCGTLADAARIVKKNGANKIYAMVSHALLAEKGLKTLEESPIDQLIVTDTVYNPALYQHPKIKIISVAPLFAEAVKIIHQKESLSALFEQLPQAVLNAVCQ